MSIFRRTFICHVVTLAISASVFAQGEPAKKTAVVRKPIVVTPETAEFHKTCLVFDGHNDLPWTIRKKADASFDKADISQPIPRFHTDIPRLKAGGLGAQFWSVYAPADTMKQNSSAHFVMEQIDLVKRMVKRYPDTFAIALTADDIVRCRKDGKIASLIGMEGGHAIENSLGLLRMFHSLGARYMTLTHSDTLDWADAATDDETHGGLTKFGEEVVRTMNDIGMLVDISHVSVETMRDALRVSRAPVIASHSSAFQVAAHPRNVPDEILRGLKANGGVVMVNYFSGFVVPKSAEMMNDMFDIRRRLREKHENDADFNKAYERWKSQNKMIPGTIHDVLDHIDHIAKVAGVDHVGLGSDYDGISTLPDQLEDVSTYPRITQGLFDRGYSKDDVRKILGENMLRVMRDAEKVAAEN